VPSMSARICSASLSLPLATSHLCQSLAQSYHSWPLGTYRGDSGSQGTVPYSTAMKMNWHASGTRHAIGPGTKLNPKVTQLLRLNPAMFKMSSITISLPRHEALDVSACQGGAVAVLMPFPMPAMMRPTICPKALAIMYFTEGTD